MIHTTTTSLPPADVLRLAKAFFAERIPLNAAYAEKEGPEFLTLRGQGGEEVVFAVRQNEGFTSIRGSTLLFDQAIDRFFSTLPIAASAGAV
ncbi:MAG: hypothetical protein ABJD11_07900 [Gemmatimonadota bacterium]